MPAVIASWRLSASGKNERGTVFRIDLQEVSLEVNADRSPLARAAHQRSRKSNQVGMTSSDVAIDLDIGEVPIKISANQRVDPDEATEPGRIAGTRTGPHETAPARSRVLKQDPCWPPIQPPAFTKAAPKKLLYLHVVGIWGVFRDKLQKNLQTFAARTNNREFQFPDVSRKFPVLFAPPWPVMSS